MNKVKIENWSIVGKLGDNYQSPENKTVHLYGNVYGHPNHDDGNVVLTTAIMHADGREVITFNTKYFLGKIDEKYKKWYYENYNKDLNEDTPFN